MIPHESKRACFHGESLFFHLHRFYIQHILHLHCSFNIALRKNIKRRNDECLKKVSNQFLYW